MLTWSEIPRKTRQPAAFLQGEGQRFRDTRLLGSTTTTNNLMVERKHRINPQKRESKSRSKQGQQGRCRRGKKLLPVSTQHPKHPCQHSPIPQEPSPQHTHSFTPLPPCKNKVQLSRGRGRCRNNSERRRKAGTDGRGPRKADRLKLETRILDEEDQGKSRTSMR